MNFLIFTLIFLLISANAIVGAMPNAFVSAFRLNEPDATGDIDVPKSVLPIPKQESANMSMSSNPLFANEIKPNQEIFDIPQSYRVKVTFTSITVHDDHEGRLSGDGEYDLNAYVRGELVKLTDLSTMNGDSGLWDVSSGETIDFPAESGITVDIDKSEPLLIFTVGSEVDGCGRQAFPPSVHNYIVDTIASGVPFVGLAPGVRNGVERLVNSVGCTFNDNDDIGYIAKAYAPTSYGSDTPHVEESSSGDFTLSYTIEVVSSPSPLHFERIK